jgi:hypothetical protein
MKKQQPFIVDVYEIHDAPGVTLKVGACDVVMTVQQARALAVDILAKVKLFNDANGVIDTSSVEGIAQALLTAGAHEVRLSICETGCSHLIADFVESIHEPGTKKEWHA